MSANLAVARRRAGQRHVWAVAKANAYGHGLERAVRAFGAADGLAVLETQEAARARAAGWSKPILLLEGVFDAPDLEAAFEFDLSMVVHSVRQLELLERARVPEPARRRPPIEVYLKADTGMSRLGFDAAQLEPARRRLAALPQLRVAALMTHFANADRERTAAAGLTVARQRAALLALAPDLPTCMSNSAALFLQQDCGDAAVRPGIALYGGSPAAGVTAASLGLRAAMSLQAELIAIRDVEAGASVGYGSRWTARRASRIGVVACGYADGYPRSAPDGTPAWVAGQRVELVGRVSMDMLSVDLTGVDAAQVGAAVELWGERVAVDEVAERAGSVGYELMCALAPRVPVREMQA